MNLLSFYNLSRPYFALAFSWRFIAVTLLLLVAVGWYSLTQYSGFNWLNLNLASLPLPVYALWLLAIILSTLFAFAMSPAERKLAKAIRLANQDLRHSDAGQLLQQANTALFLLPSAKVTLNSLQAAFYKSQGDLLKAYKELKDLQKLPLLPKEHTAIELDLMRLLYDSGNVKATQQQLTSLQKRKLSQAQQSQCHLTQAELYLIENKLQAAKDLVESHYEEPNLSANIQVTLLHTLGVIETHQQNYQSAITAYRQAWEMLKQQKNSFGQAEITIDNLGLTYAKQNETNKLQPFVQQLDALATPNNTDHQLALHNIKINLARQLNDRQALEQTYAEAEQLVNDNPKHLGYSDKLIGLAYTCYQLNTKKAQAKHWLDTYDQSKQSTNHLAAWLRQQYQETKEWVGVE